MNKKEMKLVTEDWKREYEKVIVSTKYSMACEALGRAKADPTEKNIRELIGRIEEFLSYLPIGDDEDLIQEREALLRKLDEFYYILFGYHDDPRVRELCRKYGIFIVRKRIDNNIYYVKENLPVLIPYLRDILVQAGDFATAIGLRITLPTRKKYGMRRILEEEGFEDLEV